MKILTALIILISIYSCNDKDRSNASRESNEESNEAVSDSALTPEEIFSTSLVQDVLDEEDVDLQIYLEEEFYPIASKSPKVTIDKISSSLYILSFQTDSIMKNFLLQKYYVPEKNEFVFEKKEINFDAAEKLTGN